MAEPAEDDEAVDNDPLIRAAMRGSSTRELEDLLANSSMNATWRAATERELARRRAKLAAQGNSGGGLLLILAIVAIALGGD